jgi:hypothetical protein
VEKVVEEHGRIQIEMVDLADLVVEEVIILLTQVEQEQHVKDMMDQEVCLVI